MMDNFSLKVSPPYESSKSAFLRAINRRFVSPNELFYKISTVKTFWPHFKQSGTCLKTGQGPVPRDKLFRQTLWAQN